MNKNINKTHFLCIISVAWLLGGVAFSQSLTAKIKSSCNKGYLSLAKSFSLDESISKKVEVNCERILQLVNKGQKSDDHELKSLLKKSDANLILDQLFYGTEQEGLNKVCRMSALFAAGLSPKVFDLKRYSPRLAAIEACHSKFKKSFTEKIYHSPGVLRKSIGYVREKNDLIKHGEKVRYSYKGKKNELTSYIKGMKDGAYKSWNNEGLQLVSGQYRQGKKQGKWIRKNSKGVTLSEINYESGKRHGRVNVYSDKGVKKESKHFKLGKKHGEFIYYWPNTKQKIFYKYENGVSLLEKSFDESGKLIKLNRYNKDGRLHGECMEIRNSDVKVEYEYNDGQEVKFVMYDAKGNVMKGPFLH